MEEQYITSQIGSEVEVKVYFDYQPEEPEVLHPSEDAYPGCPSEVIINSVCVGGVNGMDLLEVLDGACISALEEECEQSVFEAGKEAYERSQEEI